MRKRPATLPAAVVATLVTILVMYTLPAVAGVGDALILGHQDNNGGNETTAATANVDGPAFKFTNTFGGKKAAARINTNCNRPNKTLCAPPFATDSRGRVLNFNADYLDGWDSTELLHSGAVTAHSDNSSTNTSQMYVDVPKMSVKVTVPPGQTLRALIRFSAETKCNQSPAGTAYCRLRAMVDNAQVPQEVVFDSVRHGPNSAESASWATHAFEWVSQTLGSGEHTIHLEFRTDEASASFAVDARTLTVELIPATSATISATPAAENSDQLDK